MDCEQTRRLLLDRERGLLSGTDQQAVDAHVAGCASCRQLAESERALSAALAQLPRHTAPADLKARLAGRYLPANQPVEQQPAQPAAQPATQQVEQVIDRIPEQPAARRRTVRRVVGSLVPAALAAAALLVAIPAYYERVVIPRQQTESLMHEAVSDHLRLLISDHPLSVESSSSHQVKPWFAGRLDFAPRLSFLGDDEFPLDGGTVALLHDRRAACLVLHRRLHKISLFVLPAEGLSWKMSDAVSLGRVSARPAVWRGFSVLMWRDSELAYVLVSDLNPAELAQLGKKIVGE